MTAELRLLKKIDNPRHYLATSDMTPEELELASQLEARHLIELVPASHGVSQTVVRDSWGDPLSYGPRKHMPISRPLPERYVMLASGDHALGAFKNMTLSEEMRQWRRKERRPALLQEWNNVTDLNQADDDVPHRVLFRARNKNFIGKIFPSKIEAELFALSVEDPFIQPASDPVPEDKRNSNRKEIVPSKYNIQNRKIKTKEESEAFYDWSLGHNKTPIRKTHIKN